MPELPEVQTTVNDLSKKIIGRKIVDVWYDWGKTIKLPKAEKLSSSIRNSRIESISRRGKNILIGLDKNRLLLIHLKMTGHLLYGKWKISKLAGKNSVQSLIRGSLEEKINSFIHVVFYLDNGYELALSDVRKFAKILFGSREEVERIGEIAKIGPEPLDPKFKFEAFSAIIKKNKRKIKQVLMDPAVIAGIGNIYSDEILWLAKVHPFRPANSLNVKELKAIFTSMREILKKALKLRGTSVSDFRDPLGNKGFYGDKRLVYQRKGEVCPRCGSKIERLKMGGRSAHYCPVCQRI